MDTLPRFWSLVMTTDSELYAIARTLQINDVIEVRVLMKRPAKDELESMRITAVSIDEDKQQVNITFVPCSLPNSVRCGFGCHFFRPEPNNANKAGHWGWQSIRKVGTEQPKPLPRMPNLKGNPAYDLFM